MSEKVRKEREAIAHFFKQVREDTGLQGQLNGALAETAPETITKIANDHGFQFSPAELSKILKERAQTSLQGEVFWSMVTTLRPNGGGERNPFIRIQGPSWVQSQPYRQIGDTANNRDTRSFSALLQEIEANKE